MDTIVKRVIINASLPQKGTIVQSLKKDEVPLPSTSEVQACLECLKNKATVAGRSGQGKGKSRSCLGNKRGGAGLTGHARAWLLLSLRWEGFGGLEVEECHELTCILVGHLACLGCCRPEGDKA